MSAKTSDVKKIIREVYPRIRELRRDLHAHPETKYEEVRTGRKICEHLKRLKIPFKAKVGRTGVVGVLRGKHRGPCVALRADMDALPMPEANRFAHRSQNEGKMHACGHDGHVANLVGTAHVLARLREHLHGSVKFIFQPAEEAGIDGGATRMIRDGALENPKPDVIFGLHANHSIPLGSIASLAGPFMASADFFDIRIRGKGVHAAYPHKGLDPIVIACSVVQALQTIPSRRVHPLQPAVVTVGHITGGTARNVIPEFVTLGGTTRAYDPKTRQLVKRLVRKIPTQVARAMGGSAEVDYFDCYPSVINNENAFRFLKDVASDVLGSGNVLGTEPSMGGEDFAFYLHHVPGVFFWLGNGTPQRQLHNPKFDFDDRALRTGMLVMSELALRWGNQRK